MNKLVYISGPITGYPDNNRESFDEASRIIHALHLIPVCPLVNCPDFSHLPEDEAWLEYMRFNIPRMLRCDTVYALQDWRKSKGARIEIKLALDLGFHIRFDAAGLGALIKSESGIKEELS